MSDGTHVEVMLAGAVAAFTVDLLVYPIDTVKTRWQSRDFTKTYGSSAVTWKLPASAFRGLYQGVGSVILATLPAAGVFFTTYESAKTLYRDVLPGGIPQPMVHAVASGTAELASCLVLTPAEVIKQNAQMLRRTDKRGDSRSTTLEAWRMLRHAEGGPARQLWRGYAALAVRNLPHTAIQFPVYESLRTRMRERRHHQPLAAKSSQDKSALMEVGIINGTSAGLSGALAAIIVTPMDVVKTRMMLTGIDDAQGTKPNARQNDTIIRRRASGWDVAGRVFDERGLRGFFRGAALRAVWTAFGSGLYLGSYEVAKAWLKGGKQVPEKSSF